MAKKTITIEVNSKMTTIELKNDDGHTFSFNPNSRIGEELEDFIQTCKDKSRVMSEIPTSHSPSAKNGHTELIGKPEQFNFTKEKWIAERKSENQICHLIKTGERHTIHVYDSKYGIDEEESWANAKLIEKAPELLNILITICKFIKDEELEEIIHFPMLREAYTLIKEIATKSAIKREYRCDNCKDSGAVRVGEYEYSECPCLTDDRD